jgi:hypothetical protein
VISGSAFCKLYSSFWRDLAPTTDLFVRRINLGQYVRDFSEMEVATAPARRGFINEVAFNLFCGSIRRGERWPPNAFSADEIRAAIASIQASIARRDVGKELQFESDPDIDEMADITEQHRRMMRVFAFDYPQSTVVPEPIFAGCGIIDTCMGDLLVASTLFEIKAGDRLFRSIDVRQLVTYAALNHISKQFEITRVGLFNPRVGIRIEIGLDELCYEISGKRSVELLNEIYLATSSGEISR